MNIQLISDIHTEFHRDGGESFVRNMNPTGVDVLVIAGDFRDATGGPYAPLHHLADKYPQVVYVHGNHEFYQGSREEVLAQSRALVRACPNVAWLDHGILEIHGCRILGTPLWFTNNLEVMRLKRNINDFSEIEHYESWVYEEHAKALNFLNREVREGDIVISHYLPHPGSVAPRYVNDPLNVFYLADLSPLIMSRKPALWLHGHTHIACDYYVGPTRVVCNPFGYARIEENPHFDWKKIITVTPKKGTKP